MTRWRVAVYALYAKFDSWRALAIALDGPSDKPRGSYYHRIAEGRIRQPGATVRARIAKLYAKHYQDDVTAGYRALGRPRRYHISLELQLGERLDGWRIEHTMDWNEWHAKAHALMCREYGEGSEE